MMEGRARSERAPYRFDLAGAAARLSDHDDPDVFSTVAAAYAETGNFREAIRTAQRALQLATERSNTALAGALRNQIERYQAGRPFRDDGQGGLGEPAA